MANGPAKFPIDSPVRQRSQPKTAIFYCVCVLDLGPGGWNAMPSQLGRKEKKRKKKTTIFFFLSLSLIEDSDKQIRSLTRIPRDCLLPPAISDWLAVIWSAHPPSAFEKHSAASQSRWFPAFLGGRLTWLVRSMRRRPGVAFVGLASPSAAIRLGLSRNFASPGSYHVYARRSGLVW